MNIQGRASNIDYKITSADLVSEKTSKIQADYNILDPPMGKGKNKTF